MHLHYGFAKITILIFLLTVLSFNIMGNIQNDAATKITYYYED